MQNLDLNVSQSTVYYYAREKVWGTLKLFCKQEFRKFNDPFYQFWLCYGIFREGEYNDALNKLVKL